MNERITEPVGYTAHPETRTNISEKPVGYGIICDQGIGVEFLTLEDHQTPYSSRVVCERIVANIEAHGWCQADDHEIVSVYAIYAGAAPKPESENSIYKARK